MTALQRIRQEQEELAADTRAEEFKSVQVRWLALQREVLAIVRGEHCEEHNFEDCKICKPGGPLREDIGDLLFVSVPERPPSFPPIETMAVIEDADPGDENDSVPAPPAEGSHEQRLQKHLFSESRGNPHTMVHDIDVQIATGGSYTIGGHHEKR